MTRVEKKNLSESIYARLKNLAFAQKRPTQEILRYYAMERFLYRLSMSKYKESFFLKGGLMLMVWNPTSHRATVDIDLLAKIGNSLENISQIVKEVCFCPVLEDGIAFNGTDLAVSRSQARTRYTGVSVGFSARLHSARLPLRIDFGFSDKIFPSPVNVCYPTLLDQPSPKLQGYTPEMMIAEKLDAMVNLGLANSRMKDFYDIWKIVNQFQMKQGDMAPIIKKVFQNRNTIISEAPKAFSEAFYRNPRTVDRWNAFLKGIGHHPVPLERVIVDIKELFLPILLTVARYEEVART